ncbi:MAG: hypothetical protein V3T91_02895 [Candidatus Bipolaricaulota bacterium]
MLLSNALLGIAVINVLWGVVSSLAIADALQKHGVKVNWIFLRILIIFVSYLIISIYRRIYSLWFCMSKEPQVIDHGRNGRWIPTSMYNE